MILDAIEQVGGIYVVTADHGNAEDMVKRSKSGEPLLDKSGKIQILTSHTLQPVSLLDCKLCCPWEIFDRIDMVHLKLLILKFDEDNVSELEKYNSKGGCVLTLFLFNL